MDAAAKKMSANIEKGTLSLKILEVMRLHAARTKAPDGVDPLLRAVASDVESLIDTVVTCLLRDVSYGLGGDAEPSDALENVQSADADALRKACVEVLRVADRADRGGWRELVLHAMELHLLKVSSNRRSP
jgi:hypothetical protein